jgi:hypothetical protein
MPKVVLKGLQMAG